MIIDTTCKLLRACPFCGARMKVYENFYFAYLGHPDGPEWCPCKRAEIHTDEDAEAWNRRSGA